MASTKSKATTSSNPELITDILAKLLEVPSDEISRRFHFTVGFTINRFDELLQEIDSSAAGTFEKTLGWNFVFPANGGATGDGLISEIKIKRVYSTVNVNGTIIEDEELEYSSGSKNLTLVPKIFFQRKSIGPNQPPLSYQDAFDLTLPRFLVVPELKVKHLEAFKNWTDLVFLSRGDLEMSSSYILGEATQYNDVFFSGGLINYATPHNPLMRVEQLTIKNKHDNQLLGDEASLPFTLKGEYYLGAQRPTREWISEAGNDNSQAAPFDLQESPIPPAKVAKNVTTQQVNQTGSALLPGAIVLAPCPPFWILPDRIGQSFQRAFPDSSFEDQAAVRQASYDGLTLGFQGGSPTFNVSIPSVNLTSISAIPIKKTFLEKLQDLWLAIVALFS